MAFTDKNFGLSPRARQLLKKHGGCWGYSSGHVNDIYGEVAFSLSRYDLPNGRQLQEEVQAAPWSVGQCFFLALREAFDWLPESLWSEEEIQCALRGRAKKKGTHACPLRLKAARLLPSQP